MQSRNLLTIPEAAERLGVSDATVRRRIKDGSLKANKMAGPFGEQFFIDPDEIQSAIEMVNVIPAKHEFEMKELEQLINQSVSMALEEFHADFASIGTTIGKALQTQNEALGKDISTMQQQIDTLSNENKALIDELQALKQEQERIERNKESRDNELLEKIRAIQDHQKKSWWQRLIGS